MKDTLLADYWANTMVAEAASPLSGVSLWNTLFSMLLILALILLLAYLAQKFKWFKKTETDQESKETILYYALFGKDEFVYISKHEQNIYLTITKGKKVALSTILPDFNHKDNIMRQIGTSAGYKKSTFADIWLSMLKSRKGNK